VIYETRHALVSVGLLRPVVDSQDGGDRQRRYPFTLWHEIGIVRGVERRRKIVVFEFRIVLDGEELEAGIPTSLQKGINGL